MKYTRLNDESEAMFKSAVSLARATSAEAILFVVEERLSWEELLDLVQDARLIIAADVAEFVEGAKEAGFHVIVTDDSGSTVQDKLSQAILEAVADEFLQPGARVVALYSGFEADRYDSISMIDLGDHLGRLTVRDLQQLETRVPLDTLQTVVNLALEIGREGREGKPVGSIFVVGDSTKVRKMSHPAGFDPVRGYSRRERNLKSPRVREGIKEIAQMDGAFIVAADGTVEAAAQILNASTANVTLSKGLGARHWAAAAVTRSSKAVAVVVSESSGTVRIFQNGEVVLRIEPFRRAMKWRDLEHESHPGDGE